MKERSAQPKSHPDQTEVLSVGGSPRDFVLNDTGCRHGNVNSKRPITPSETLSVA